MAFSLHLEDLRVAYSDQSSWIIDHLELALQSRRCIGIEGNNGAGKSTLAHAIVGLIPDITPGRVEGHAWMDSTDLFSCDLPTRLGLVGYSFQDTESQILFGTVGDVLGLTENETSQELMALAICDLRIEHLLQRTPDELSGGESQRVALATAIRRGPRLIIYDEASSALDPHARRNFKLFADHLKQREHSLMLLGQRREILGPYCDAVLSLQGGKLVDALTGAYAESSHIKEFWLAASEMLTDSIEAPELQLKKIKFARSGEGGFVLGPVDVSFNPGETVAIVGPNGSGKTTLFLLLLGALKPRSGVFELARRKYKAAKPNPWPKTVTMVSQSPLEQIVSGTVGLELGLTSPLDGESRHLAKEILEHFPYLRFDRDPLELSHGQQRMLGMLACFLSRHPILIIDEPEQALDATSLQYVQSWLEINARERSKTVIFSTHDLAFAAKMASRCLLMTGGQIVAEIATKDPVELERWYFSHTKENRD